MDVGRRGWVYFALRRDGLIKIGFTADLATRMRGLRTRLLATIPGRQELEWRILRRFAVALVKGRETFHLTPELQEFIARHRVSYWDSLTTRERSHFTSRCIAAWLTWSRTERADLPPFPRGNRRPDDRLVDAALARRPPEGRAA